MAEALSPADALEAALETTTRYRSLWGDAAARRGGPSIDNLMMRLTDVAYAFPDILMLILLLSVFGPNFIMIFVAIGLVSWPTLARLIRGQILSLQERAALPPPRAPGATP